MHPKTITDPECHTKNTTAEEGQDSDMLKTSDPSCGQQDERGLRGDRIQSGAMGGKSR